MLGTWSKRCGHVEVSSAASIDKSLVSFSIATTRKAFIGDQMSYSTTLVSGPMLALDTSR